MLKKALLPGFLGGIVFIFWTFIVNAMFGFKSSLDMKPFPNESQVYEILKENIKEPGRYACNPQVSEMGFPANEPAFSILYGGMGHEVAGWLMLVQLPIFLLAPILGTIMLSFASPSVTNNYLKKVLFFTGFGLLIALFSDLLNFGIGSYPPKDALILALHDIAVWTVIGLVVAWRFKPNSNITA
ncbi:MAG: hypothetical protein HQ528_09465 [Candidatus Marinimicrobia bacterium]|nr:hypothetical protein [Candidatus Neomarinimicrobiota bacterium]